MCWKIFCYHSTTLKLLTRICYKLLTMYRQNWKTRQLCSYLICSSSCKSGDVWFIFSIVMHAYIALSALTESVYFKWEINNHSLLNVFSLTLCHFFFPLLLSAGRSVSMGKAHWSSHPCTPPQSLTPSPLKRHLNLCQNDIHKPTAGLSWGGAEVWPGDWEEIWDCAFCGLFHVLPLWNHLLLLW